LLKKYKELCSSHLLRFSLFFLFYTSCWCKGLSCLWQPLWLLYSSLTTTWNWTPCTIFCFFTHSFPLGRQP
jgi:hypothetical protein